MAQPSPAMTTSTTAILPKGTSGGGLKESGILFTSFFIIRVRAIFGAFSLHRLPPFWLCKTIKIALYALLILIVKYSMFICII